MLQARLPFMLVTVLTYGILVIAMQMLVTQWSIFSNEQGLQYGIICAHAASCGHTDPLDNDLIKGILCTLMTYIAVMTQTSRQMCCSVTYYACVLFHLVRIKRPEVPALVSEAARKLGSSN